MCVADPKQPVLYFKPGQHLRYIDTGGVGHILGGWVYLISNPIITVLITQL